MWPNYLCCWLLPYTTPSTFPIHGQKALIEEGETYVTENRLANVVSHIGEVHFPKDFGRVMGELSKDVQSSSVSCSTFSCPTYSSTEKFLLSLPSTRA